MAKTIKLTEKTNKIAKTYLERVRNCDSGLLSLSEQRKEAHRQLWDTIKAECPEVADVNKNSVYESETGEVFISLKWDDNDQMKKIKQYIDLKIEDKFNGE